MTTPPWPAATLDMAEARQQAVRFEFVLREVRQFRAFCCNINADGIMGVSKMPVPVLSITPNPVCDGLAITYDFAGSFAPGSAVVSRSIDFGNGVDIPGCPVSGNYIYPVAGTYTITGTVENGLGTTQDIEVEVNVIDCAGGLLLNWVYVATTGRGVWRWE